MKALFLIECGMTFGLGHLRRCQVLGRAMMDEGWSCRFGLSETDMVEELRDEGYDAQEWCGDALNLQDQDPIDVLVVDGYHYDPALLTRWRAHAGVSLALDDLAERPVLADVILNHNLYGADLDYAAYGSGIVIGGAEYALVDTKFFVAAGKTRPKPAHIVVSFGGTDDGRFAIAVTEGLLAGSADEVIEVVISPLHGFPAALLPLKDRYGFRLIVHHGVDMADVMGHCCVLVGAAGVSVLEALAAGLDLVVCASADNQRLNVQILRKLGFVAFDGFDPDAVTQAVLAMLVGNKGCQVRSRLRSVLDGQGPKRVIDVLTETLGRTGKQGTMQCELP